MDSSLLTAFCRNYFEVTRLPVSLLHEEAVAYSSLAEFLNIKAAKHWPLFPMEHNPSFCAASEDILYGRIHVEHTKYDVIVGPAFGISVTDDLVRKTAFELSLSVDLYGQLQEFLYSLPQTPPTVLVRHLSILHMSLNGKRMDIDAFFASEKGSLSAENVNERVARLESGEPHNTYLFELGMYECIKSGNLERLTRYFEENDVSGLYGGKYAASPLRHAKNVFIAGTMKTAFLGAIPGGLDVDTAYQMAEYYVQECERCATIEAVSNLQYAMVIDFCRRTGTSKIPEGISSDIFVCMNYISSHVYDTISIRDVADRIGKSESWLMKKFREETGVSVGEYITKTKLAEAKSLLTYTDKSLAEISSYLGFSSQPYFQNVFKRVFDITPMQFRKKSRTM